MAKRRKHGGGRRRAARGDEAPVRTCVSCRASAPKEGLLRFVRAPDGSVAFDVRGRMPGRGAWTCASASCVAAARDRGGFARAFEAPVLVEPELIASVLAILEKEALSGLALLRRQVQLWPGRSEALKRLGTREAAHLVAAHDLSPRSVEELHRAVGADTEVVSGPGKDAIGQVLGRSATGVVGLAPGSFSERVLADLARWARLGSTPESGVGPGAPLRSQMAGV